MKNRLAAHVAMVDFTGLLPDARIDKLEARVAIPAGWDAMTPQSTPLYEHQQWRSTTRMTAVGVAHIHLPLPISAKTLVWIAKSQYSKQNAEDHKPNPKLLTEWTDPIGREWFEGENEKYHMKGYVVCNGMDAWGVYIGYRVHGKQDADEIDSAFRSMDSVVPFPLLKNPGDAAN